MKTFTNQSLQTILSSLKNKLSSEEYVHFIVLNPDISEDSYAGTTIIIDTITYIYRGYKAWIDLAELLHCKMLTPEKTTEHLVKITFKKLQKDSFHSSIKEKEKYGVGSTFAQIHKMEEPAFLYYYTQALDNVNIEDRTDILNLGINRADEFYVIKNRLDTKKYEEKQFVGIDHSATAIEKARELLPEKNITFYTADINDLDSLNIGTFDLLISIGTLQSPSIHFKPFFMKLVQEYLKKDSAIILGFPNSRWRGGEVIYGAKVPNYTMSELGHLFSDVMFCKKYLQQKNYRVTITGKYYIFLTATKIC